MAPNKSRKKWGFNAECGEHMTQFREPDNTIAPLRNVSNFLTMVDRLRNRGAGLPGMGTFYGPAGWGKTSAAVYAATTQNAIVITLGDSVTRRWMCEMILKELGVKPKGGIPHMTDAIAEHMAMNDAPLIIDEADHLVKKKAIELAREIFEKSQSPVILIGEEELPQKLTLSERVASRMLVWTAAEPCDDMDLRILSKRLCPGMELSPEVEAKLLKVCRGSLRRMATNLDNLRHFCAVRGIDRISDVALDGFEYFTGIAPRARMGIS